MDAIRVNESTDGNGVVVTLSTPEGRFSRYLPFAGGEWQLLDDGTTGRQLAGTSDVRVPRDLAAAQKWAAARYAEIVA